ncbi:hypothetical protein JW898_05185 [Candidatus Woesearchaeota archaeon]|nr:hypothetical protein [Candidatus Woesearchaeota archaeon]
MEYKSSPKESLRILNTREKKEINQQVSSQWGCELDRSLVWLLSNKGKLYVADNDIGSIDFRKLKIDKIGLYVCTVSDKGVRLSIEGSQLIGPCAKKNVVDVSDDGLKAWFRGEDLEKTVDGCSGFVILRHDGDFIGCGKATEKGVLNFVPKTRRVLGVD